MNEFGKLLREYRARCHDPQRKRALTQARLAELVSLASNTHQSGSSISNWERGLNQIRRDDRQVLVGLIKVLYQCGGIKAESEATRLLLAGNYRPLNDKELEAVNPAWKRAHLAWTPDASFPSIAEQAAQLPHPAIHLFGREALLNTLLNDLLLPKSPYILMLVGLGGIGKTAVANALARQAIETAEFAQVLWITLNREDEDSNVGTVRDDFQALIQQLSIAVLSENTANHQNSRQFAARVRLQLKRHRYLIFIDNLEQAKDLDALVNQLNRLVEPTKIVGMTRIAPSPKIESQLYLLQTLDLTAATDLLRHQAQLSRARSFSQLDETAWEAIVETIGGHPLTLRLIPRLVDIMPLDTLLEAWKKVQGKYITEIYQAIYRSIWEKLLPAERQLLYVMLLISKHGAQSEQLTRINGMPLGETWSTLLKLTDQCLIEAYGTATERRFRIHSLTENFIYLMLEKEGDRKTFYKATRENIFYWVKQLNRDLPKEWQAVAAERANIFRAVKFSLSLPQNEVTSQLKKSWKRLYERLFRFIEQRGYAHEWLPLLAIGVERFEDDSADACHLLNRLGVLYRLNHELDKAIETHELALQKAEAAEIEEYVARAHLNLGTDYYAIQEYEMAAEHGQHALEMFGNVGKWGREQAATLNLLGITSLARQELTLAKTYFVEAAELWRQKKSHPELARTLNNLAQVYQQQDQADKAIICFKEASDGLRDGDSILDQTLIYLSEGSLYFSQGHFKKAKETFERIQLDYLEESGQKLYKAMALNNLGQATLQHGENLQAAQLFKESLAIWRQLGNNLEVANAFSGFADAQRQLGNLELAQSAYREIFSLLRHYTNEARAKRLLREAKLKFNTLERS